jgi:MFS family permease
MASTELRVERPALFYWWHAANPQARLALVAASLGWMLDAFDVMLYSMVLAAMILDLGITKQQAGLLGSLTLLASAAGGIVFGVVADRAGRTRALMGSVLLYSVFTGMCGLAQNLTQLAVCRVLLGIGMGGEWASGAALVSETWSAEHRGKAFGFMQSSWAIGYAVAAWCRPCSRGGSGARSKSPRFGASERAAPLAPHRPARCASRTSLVEDSAAPRSRSPG